MLNVVVNDDGDESGHHHDPLDKNKKPWPEDCYLQKATTCLGVFHRWWEQWTFSYMRPLLMMRHGTAPGQQGEERNQEQLLSHADLYQVPCSMHAYRLHQRFWECYQREEEKEKKRQQSPSYSKKQRDYGLLLRTFWEIGKSTFVPAGVCQFISILCQVAVPLFVRQLLDIVQEVEDDETEGEDLLRQKGLPYAFAILVALLTYGLTQHKLRHWAAQTGISIRGAIVVVLYERILQLTPPGRSGLSNGLVSTLIAVDTQKIYEVAQEGHLIWALPLAIVLVSLSLVWVMGPVTLVGIAVLIANVPLVQSITSSMLRIRSKRVRLTDERVELTNALLRGIQVTKLNHHEQHYEQALTNVRNRELHHLQREAAVWATTLSVSKLSAAMAAAATFATHTVVLGNVLTAATSFSVFLLFAALRFPIGYTGRLLGKLAQAKSSLQRIDDFLQRPVRERTETKVSDCDDAIVAGREMQASDTQNPLLLVQKGSFSVGRSEQDNQTIAKISETDQATTTKSKPTFTVSGLDFSVDRGEMLAIVGPVGSGKTTIINGLIDEVSKTNETIVSVNGRVALAPQTPFILNATIRDNILFGRPLDKERYQAVVDACCLGPDIRALRLTGGDLTEIGERGVTLSGGQKSRVALARAAYGKPDLLLLDDPLSALDAGTAKQVFQNLLMQGGLLTDTAFVLVTHASHFLNRVDRIMVIVNGKGQFLGTWSELTLFECSDATTMDAILHLRESVQEDEEKQREAGQLKSEITHQSVGHVPLDKASDKQTSALMTIEEREHGMSSISTWLLWFFHAGGMFFFGILLFLLIADRAAYFGQEYWVAIWTEGAEESVNAFGIDFPPQTEGVSAQYKYLAAYAVILFTALAANLARSEWSVTGGSRAARNVFSAMLKSVLHAPITFFQTTPMGRILNRFTYDMEIVDFELTQNMSLFLVALSSYVSGVAVMIGIVPYVAVVLIPATVLYCFLMWYYRKAGIDLQRLDAMSRSPIQAMVTEAMEGYTTIRVFESGSIFLRRFYAAVDTNSSAMLNYIAAQRWLGTRIEMMGAFIVFIPVLLLCCFNDRLGLSAGLAGLLITGSMNFTLALSFLVDFFGSAEASITAIERVDAMGDLPREPDWDTKPGTLEPSWPQNGELVFQQVCMRYRPELPLALNGLSFTCPAGKRIAVCGRTGAGKSSLTVSLFRLVDIESGRILLDGVDLSSIGLADVRGRCNGMSIISQDPFLTGRTVRECLDPVNAVDDMEINRAINAVSLKILPESPIEEGGSNLSVGERQLLTLASALLSKPKVLVLDEATASIDGATDALIQQMLRTKFPNTTLLTIAHRLNTIMDYDFILVMEAGKAAEFGTPSELLSENGLFAELVNATGPESAKALRGIALQAASTKEGPMNKS